MKGVEARRLLWTALREKLTNADEGEPELLLKLTDELQEKPARGLPPSKRLADWAYACKRVFNHAFQHPPASHAGNLLEHVMRKAGLSCSELIYVPYTTLEKVREIVRELETHRPFAALFDIAVIPAVLSYPSRRRLKLNGKSVIGECFAVSDVDPSRWARKTGHWIPLSESAFGHRDHKRWVQIMTVSPWPDDPSVPHILDRFRERCRHADIEILDIDPANPV
jgi:hypothetical protein